MDAVAGPFVDLTRHALALSTIGERAASPQSSAVIKGIHKAPNHERAALQRVFDDAATHPEAFTNAPDVWLGTHQLGHAITQINGAVTAVRGGIEAARARGAKGFVVDELPTPTGVPYSHQVREAVDLLHEAHANLGGTRELPEYEAGAPIDRATLAIADRNAAPVRNQLHQIPHFISRLGMNAGLRQASGIRIIGAENVPKRGGGFIAMDHVTAFDTYRALASVGRTFRPVASQDGQYAKVVDGTIARVLGAIPFKQGNKADGFVNLLGALAADQLLLMFPEGKRSLQALQTAHGTGIPQLASEMQVPVTPIAQWGAGHRALTGRTGLPGATVAIGKPLQPPAAATPYNIALFQERLAREHGKLMEVAHADQLEHASYRGVAR